VTDDDLDSLPDYLGRDDLLALGIDPDEADTILRHSPLTGHDGQPVVEADRVAELLDERGDHDDD
jgi:hypothetical protein